MRNSGQSVGNILQRVIEQLQQLSKEKAITSENSDKLEHVSNELDNIKSQLQMVSQQAAYTNQLQYPNNLDMVFSDRQNTNQNNPLSIISPIA